MHNRSYRTFAEINLDNILHNCEVIRKRIGEECKFLSILKSDAYGHGLAVCGPVFEQCADEFAVASFEEAIALRNANVKKPILILGSIDYQKLFEACENDFSITIISESYFERVCNILSKAGKQIKCWLELDTGLNRQGIDCKQESADEVAVRLARLYDSDCLDIKGIFMHFACADSVKPDDIAFTHNQYDLLTEICDTLKDKGFEVGIRSCSSGSAFLWHPDKKLDMVRLGALSFGLGYTGTDNKMIMDMGFKPLMSWKARIMQLRDIKAGEFIGYGRIVKAEKNMRIAIIAVGYGDGYKRSYSNKARTIVNGQYAPVIGDVFMDYSVIDVTSIDDVREGDLVTLLGEDGDLSITADELGFLSGCTCGDITCSLTGRVPKYYLRNGIEVEV